MYYMLLSYIFDVIYNPNYFSITTFIALLIAMKHGLNYMYNSIFINYDIIHITLTIMMSDLHIFRNIG